MNTMSYCVTMNILNIYCAVKFIIELYIYYYKVSRQSALLVILPCCNR